MPRDVVRAEMAGKTVVGNAGRMGSGGLGTIADKFNSLGVIRAVIMKANYM